MLTQLLAENGSRWMSPQEQFRSFPASRALRPYDEVRPVWLVLSIIVRERGFKMRNGLSISGQMNNIREALKS